MCQINSGKRPKKRVLGLFYAFLSVLFAEIKTKMKEKRIVILCSCTKWDDFCLYNLEIAILFSKKCKFFCFEQRFLYCILQVFMRK